MPASSTITTFYTMVANQRARASHSNNNFSVFRGHLISVDPNTAASTDLTYDVGSDEHRWRTGYFQDMDFETSTSTASLLLAGDTSATLGAFKFSIEGVEQFRVLDTGIKVPYARTLKMGGVTTTNDVVFQTPSATVGGLAFLQNGSIIFAFDTAGVYHQYFQPRTYSTSGAATGPASIVLSPQISLDAYTGTSTPVPNSTCTIATIGRPVRVAFVAGPGGGGYYGCENTTGASVATGGRQASNISVMRDGNTICGLTLRTNASFTTTFGNIAGMLTQRSGPGELCIDFPGVTTAAHYCLNYRGSEGNASESKTIIEGRLQIETIY